MPVTIEASARSLSARQPPAAIGRRTFLAGVAGLAVAACGGGGGGAARRHRIVERGVNYDVGTGLFGGLTRTPWTTAHVERELSAIRDELGCTAVLLVGSEVDRLQRGCHAGGRARAARVARTASVRRDAA